MLIPQGFLEGISPRAFAVLDGKISEVLALPLLCAAFEGTVSVNGSTISLLPFELSKEIRQKWRLCTVAEGLSKEAVNPIENILFTVQQLGNQLMIVPHPRSTVFLPPELRVKGGGRCQLRKQDSRGMEPQKVSGQMPFSRNFFDATINGRSPK